MAHPVLGAGIGGALGGLAGFVAGAWIYPYRESIEGIRAWKEKYPGFRGAPDQEVLQAMSGESNAAMGIFATLGTFVGALVGAGLSGGCPKPSTGTAGVGLPNFRPSQFRPTWAPCPPGYGLIQPPSVGIPGQPPQPPPPPVCAPTLVPPSSTTPPAGSVPFPSAPGVPISTPAPIYRHRF
jgi:hypothetical protein